MEIQEFNEQYEIVIRETGESFSLLGDFLEDGETLLRKKIGCGELAEAAEIFRKLGTVKEIFSKYYEFDGDALSEDSTLKEIFVPDADLSFDLPLTQEKLKNFSVIFGKFPQSATGSRLAGLLVKAGIDAENHGDSNSAEKMYLKAVELYKDTYDDEFETPPDILSPLWNLALLYRESGHADKAAEYADEGIGYCKEFASIEDIFNNWLEKFRSLKDLVSGK